MTHVCTALPPLGVAQHGIVSLIRDIVERFPDLVKEVTYVKTFQQLKAKYDSYMGNTTASGDDECVCSAGACDVWLPRVLQDVRRADGELLTHHAHMHDQCARIVRTDQLHNPDNENTSSESILLLLMPASSEDAAKQNGCTCCFSACRAALAATAVLHAREVAGCRTAVVLVMP